MKYKAKKDFSAAFDGIKVRNVSAGDIFGERECEEGLLSALVEQGKVEKLEAPQENPEKIPKKRGRKAFKVKENKALEPEENK